MILRTPEKGVIPQATTLKDTMIHSLCQGFVKNGHDVTLVASEEYRAVGNEEYDFDVLFLKSRCRRVFKPSLIPFPDGLATFLRKNGSSYDIIISSEVFSIASLIAARIVPEKLIIWQEMSMHQRKFFKIPSKMWHNLVVRFLMKKVRMIVPRSDYAGNFIKKYSSRVSDSIVEHGIDIDKFDCSIEKQRYLISSSQLIPRKNIDGIIRKFADLHSIDKYSDIKLLIAGKGSEEQALKQLVRQLGIEDYVVFLGFLSQKELNEYIRKSLCFLVNTRQDLNIVSIPEAIVSGTPVLTNSIPSSITYIKNNSLGIVKDAWGVDELRLIIDKNDEYVNNCVAYRANLTNVGIADSFIKLSGDD